MKPRRNFDEVAAAWDEQPGRLKVMGNIATAMFDRIPLTADMDVMDFGCGTGLLSLRVADQVKSLTGVDTSEAMLARFEQKAKELELDHVHSLKVDLDQGADIPGRYDMVVSSMVFHHIENIESVMVRLYDVLKPNGILCVADLDLDGGLFHEDPTGVFHDGFDRSDFARLLKKAGFGEVHMEQATEVVRPQEDGSERRFSIFMATGQRS